MYFMIYQGCLQIMRFRMVGHLQGQENHVLRNSRLCLSVDHRGVRVRWQRRHLVHRSLGLWDDLRENALLQHFQKRDNEQDNKRKLRIPSWNNLKIKIFHRPYPKEEPQRQNRHRPSSQRPFPLTVMISDHLLLANKSIKNHEKYSN